MRRGEPPEKPYQLVPFPSEQPTRKEGIGQDRAHARCLSGWLDIELFTLRPLQVATGITDFANTGSGQEQLALMQVSVKRCADDDPHQVIHQTVLPGSALKGALRGLVEALSPSCVSIVSMLVRSVLPRQLTHCTNPKSLCPACRLFGAQDYQGQVSVADAQVPPGNLSIIGVPLLWTPARTGGRGLPPLYLSYGEARGRKVYEHRRMAWGPDPRVVIKKNVTIPTRISFTNLTSGELGLLVSALGNHPQYPFPIKIGAGKPVGMGSVEVHIKTAVLLRGDEVKHVGRLGRAIDKAERLEGKTLTQRLAHWTQQAQRDGVLLINQLNEVAKALDRTNLNRPAPHGIY